MAVSERITAVASALIAPDVSLTVVRYADGWGFHRWTTMSDVPLESKPSADDVSRRFDTDGAAIDHFCSTYGRKLR